MGAGSDFPKFEYADDTLIILESDESQLSSLKDLLNNFASSSGLKVNYNVSDSANKHT